MQTRTTLALALATLVSLSLSACDADEPAATVDDVAPGESIGLDGVFAPSSQPQTVAGLTYQCQIDVGSAWTDCDPAIVDAAEFDPSEWRAKVIMANDQAEYRRMDIFAEVCDPTNYAFAVADSPTTNGWGGDSGTSDHDAEAHLFGTSMNFFSTTDFLHGAFGNSTTLAGAHAGGCVTTHTVVYHEIGSNVAVCGYEGGGSPLTIRDTQGFKLDYDKCPGGAADPSRGVTCDVEDSGRADEGLWYFGLNRTVGAGKRDGTGVKRACVVLNDDVTVVPDDCLAPAPIEAVPEGTRKMCMEAGTPAEMLADCEAGAAVNVGMFTGGTWSTQDYINQWGDPCPPGTSIIAGSQFYVGNSCNPLPNVGIDCAGPGSFNYEFQIGVQCQ
ncbi:hypothetical protein ACNOYE_32360 [Nannocystaceae bacterium ST9]